MTQEINQTELQTWWDDISFSGKEQYQLKDNGTLVFVPNVGKERQVATLNTDNVQTLFKALQDKYPEAETKVQELEAEWNNTEDKLKLSGKVERLKDYLLHANAVGDINSLLQRLGEWEQVLNTLSEENYNVKLQLVEKAEALAQSENWKETTQAYKDLAEQWKQTGYVPKSKNDALWNRLEEARNKFYERKRQNHDEQEKDMLYNLDRKMELVEKAEALTMSEDWKKTTETFRELMEEWKNTGRTMHEKNEELWNRFINAKNTFYDRKKVHFESIQQEQEHNYELKRALVERAEAMQYSTDWTATTQAFADLMEEWKNIGRVPTERGDELWDRLNAAKEVYYTAKRHHFENMLLSLENNYTQKMALLKRAEALKNSSQWREATDEMNELMTEWKKIGAVPREHSNEIWEQFITARKYFFERKDAHREHKKKQVEKFAQIRSEQARHTVKKLHEEIKDDEEKLVDFRNGLENITPGLKAEELRAHLQNLIQQTEEELQQKRKKLANLEKEAIAKQQKPQEKTDVAGDEEEV